MNNKNFKELIENMKDIKLKNIFLNYKKEIEENKKTKQESLEETLNSSLYRDLKDMTKEELEEEQKYCKCFNENSYYQDRLYVINSILENMKGE